MPSAAAALHLATLLPAPRGGAMPAPTVSNAYNGLFFGLCPAGAELGLMRWLEQVVAMQIDESQLCDAADDAAARRAQQVGEAYGGAAKLRAVSAWMRCVGRYAGGQPPSRQE
eukprot:4703433-Prymnesium_polylepis.1